MGSATATDIDIARALGELTGVERVYVSHAGDVVHVFTLIDQEDESVYDGIYNKERCLIHEFHPLHFNFNVVARRGREPEEVMGSGPPTWRRD